VALVTAPGAYLYTDDRTGAVHVYRCILCQDEVVDLVPVAHLVGGEWCEHDAYLCCRCEDRGADKAAAHVADLCDRTPRRPLVVDPMDAEHHGCGSPGCDCDREMERERADREADHYHGSYRGLG
jgi:hypothetical protein